MHTNFFDSYIKICSGQKKLFAHRGSETMLSISISVFLSSSFNSSILISIIFFCLKDFLTVSFYPCLILK